MAPRARALSCLCLLAEVRDDWHQARWVGPAQARPRWVSLSLLYSVSVFYLFLCFELVKILIHFQNS